MRLIEGFYVPRPQVKVIKSKVPRYEVAQVVNESFVCKGMACSGSDIEQAINLAALNDGNIPSLLSDPSIVWNHEVWPINLLRVSRMHPDGDPLGLSELEKQCGQDFLKLARELRRHPNLIQLDLGFLPQSKRDHLPLIGVRGRLHNHILDGHHRTLLAVWSQVQTISCLTAYRRPSFFS